MGNSTYSLSSRNLRAASAGYYKRSFDEISTQTKERKAHADMMPTGITFRECRDSEAHPNSLPIKLWLDLTGSMGMIPDHLIKDGLPKLMGTLTQNGVPDAAVMFGGVGDHECDQYPLQVGQFESGDAELDLHLTRTYLEKGGGGNSGESYHLAWYFSRNHTKTDAMEKRARKGYCITIGDEPCLENLPMTAIKQIMGNSAVGQESNYTRDQLLAAAREVDYVYHIHVNHGRPVDSWWQQALGQNLIVVDSYEQVPTVISDLILKNESEISQTVSEGDEQPLDHTKLKVRR